MIQIINPTTEEQSTYPESTSSELNTSSHRPRYRRPLLAVLILAILFSAASAFAGVLLGVTIAQKQSVKLGSTQPAVIYQSVIRTSTLGELTEVLSLPDIAEATRDSVVEITTETVASSSRMRQFVVQGAGSGVVITTDGYIVTNNHVTVDASKISVRLTSGETFEATLIGEDPQTDLAVIKVNTSGLTPAVFGDSSLLKVGDLAVVIGNPLGELGGTVTDGIISALDREISIDGETMTLLQTNAAINPGNSGGGMFNARAELVGIVNAKTSGSDIEGLGFVIPINTAKSVINSLIKDGYVSGRPGLGAALLDISDAATAMRYRVSQLGVYVVQAESDVDLQPGDLILAIDNQEVSSSTEIKTILSQHAIGDLITIQVKRGANIQNIEITIQELM
jgi:serine protease Do